jgi:hypothetical protein
MNATISLVEASDYEGLYTKHLADMERNQSAAARRASSGTATSPAGTEEAARRISWRAHACLVLGEISRGLKALSPITFGASSTPEQTAATVATLEGMQPDSKAPIPPRDAVNVPGKIEKMEWEPGDVATTIKRASRGSGQGPSGDRTDFYLPFVDRYSATCDTQSEGAGGVLGLLTEWCQQVEAGDVPDGPIADAYRSSRLVAMVKRCRDGRSRRRHRRRARQPCREAPTSCMRRAEHPHCSHNARSQAAGEARRILLGSRPTAWCGSQGRD